MRRVWDRNLLYRKSIYVQFLSSIAFFLSPIHPLHISLPIPLSEVSSSWPNSSRDFLQLK